LLEILDIEIAEEEPYKYGKLLSIFLLLIGFFFWQQLYSAHLLPYDENYGTLLFVLFFSLLIFVGLLIIYFRWRVLIFQNWISISVYLVFNSPISILLVCVNYEAVFGTSLQH